MPEKFQTILFLVRHGETDHNYSQNPATDQQRQLTIFGRKQSCVVGQFLDQFSPAVIYSSPLDRCIETAKLIRAEIESRPEIIKNTALYEIYSETPKVRHEAGERGETIFSTVLRDHRGEQVVAVTHQYIIGYIVADFFNIDYQSVRCEFADVYRLVFANDNLVEVARLQPAYEV
ncbi:MAG: phosphoglycerate mutase family protein [Patescibacteria group bacterium]